MRLLILSDLHVEAAPFEPAAFDADVVVLAGDIHNGTQAVQWARSTFPRHPIVQIAGNHEFYDGEHGEVLASLRAAARQAQVHFLENDAVEIDGVRFLGCTLWTDYRVFEAPGRALALDREQAMAANARLIADYFAIRTAQDGAPRPFTPGDAVRLHQASSAWLAQALLQPFTGPTVVVTHHLPSWRSVYPAYAEWVTNAAFVSDVDHLIERACCWIHGHTHTSPSYRAGATIVRCNPRGYPRHERRPDARTADAGAPAPPAVFENPAFDPALVLRVPGR